jgi:hypothetical protein
VVRIVHAVHHILFCDSPAAPGASDKMSQQNKVFHLFLVGFLTVILAENPEVLVGSGCHGFLLKRFEF